MANYKYLDDGAADGAVLGRSGGKIGFYGTTPATVPSCGSTAVTTAAITTTTNNYGFANTTQLTDLCAVVNSIRSALSTLGLISVS